MFKIPSASVLLCFGLCGSFPDDPSLLEVQVGKINLEGSNTHIFSGNVGPAGEGQRRPERVGFTQFLQRTNCHSGDTLTGTGSQECRTRSQE